MSCDVNNMLCPQARAGLNGISVPAATLFLALSTLNKTAPPAAEISNETRDASSALLTPA